MAKGLKIIQFMMITNQGGGERVMNSICKIYGTKLYTGYKQKKGERFNNIKEISTYREKKYIKKFIW